MFSAGAYQLTALTSPVCGSVIAYGGVAAGGGHAAVAAGAVEPAVGRGLEQLLAPRDERLSLLLDGAGLAVGLEDPVQRQADDQDDEQQHAEDLHALEALALERLVVVVRLAVRRHLDSRSRARLARGRG